MKTITVYTPSELKEENPEGFERAHEWYKNHYCDEIPWQGEIMDSLKAVFKASGITLKDWSISPWSYSYVKFEMNSYDYGDSEVWNLSGQRAVAWLENNLFGDLRYKWGIRHIKERVWKADCVKNPSRKDGAFIHQAGELKECPFTGVCFDEDFMESLRKSIKNGDTLQEAYSELANVAARLFEDEIEQAQSEDEFLLQDHLEFTIDGDNI